MSEVDDAIASARASWSRISDDRGAAGAARLPTRARARNTQAIGKRLGYIAERLEGPYLFGDTFTPADAYLYVMLRWAKGMGIAWPDPLGAYFERVQAREAVQLALKHEGLN